MRRSNVKIVAVQEMLAVTSGDDDAVWPRLIGESAREVDGQAEHIASDADSRTGRNAAVHWRHQIDRSQSGDEIKRDPDCVIEVVGDEPHRPAGQARRQRPRLRRRVRGIGGG